jgi:hypothetical protein
MDRCKAAFFVLCVGATLLGCGEGEQSRWLAYRQRHLDLELAEKVEIAQNLNERRRELDVLEQQLVELRADLNRPSGEELSRRLAGLGLETMTFREEAGVLGLRLGDSGGAPGLMAALRALHASERVLALKRVSVEPKAWSVELEVPAEPKPSVQEKPSMGRRPEPTNPMPRASFLEALYGSDKLSRLQDRLRQTEQRIAELDKVLGEVVRLNQRKVDIEAQVNSLKVVKPGERLVGQRALVEALFSGRKPRLATGVVEFQGDRLTLKGLGSGDAAKRLASLAEVGRVLQADTDAIVLSTAGQP